jgi:hypothetical protein
MTWSWISSQGDYPFTACRVVLGREDGRSTLTQPIGVPADGSAARRYLAWLDEDQKLASDIWSSREAIWDLLADPQKFATLQL